jgi:hypothetical protein
MVKSGRPTIGKVKMIKTIPVKVTEDEFIRLREAQTSAKNLVKTGKRKKDDMEELAITLRNEMKKYITKLEDFVINGKNMKDVESI